MHIIMYLIHVAFSYVYVSSLSVIWTGLHKVIHYAAFDTFLRNHVNYLFV